MEDAQVCRGVATGPAAAAKTGEVHSMAMSPGPPRRSGVDGDSEDRSVTPAHPGALWDAGHRHAGSCLMELMKVSHLGLKSETLVSGTHIS